MAITKHKIFHLYFENKDKLTADTIIEQQIEEFLNAPNTIYVNHSIAIMTESIEEYGAVVNRPKFVLISLVYKDLSGTTLDLKSASTKVKKMVKKEIESGEKIEKPNHLTDIDKLIMKNKEERDKLLKI